MSKSIVHKRHGSKCYSFAMLRPSVTY